MRDQKVIITGGAGLVGQNLLVLLKDSGWSNLTVIDKHTNNLNLLRRLHPEVTAIEVDLAKKGAWEEAFVDADLVVQAHAQIGGLNYEPFEANNITATRHVLDAVRGAGGPFLVHLSSSVVNSMADDHYTRSKTLQEQMVVESGLQYCALRPTLMFGWFDRKHLGWLARFMKKAPVFPIPGSGRYLRQPLYVQDFCRVIVACMEQRPAGETYDITGLEQIYYIDLIRAMKLACGARTPVIRIPYTAFDVMLRAYGLVDRNPPFTVAQLQALVTPDIFDVIDWPGIFDITPTSLAAAFEQTFSDPRYSDLELEF